MSYLGVKFNRLIKCGLVEKEVKDVIQASNLGATTELEIIEKLVLRDG